MQWIKKKRERNGWISHAPGSFELVMVELEKWIAILSHQRVNPAVLPACHVRRMPSQL